MKQQQRRSLLSDCWQIAVFELQTLDENVLHDGAG
jgi:hypothetical protein